MNVAAIISEYNPFHTGHIYQIQDIKKQLNDPYILSLMSGNFVQRGGCSIIDKHSRAKLAIKNGIDLVLELPCFFSTQVAEIFAQGSISILNDLGIVDTLCFGSETGNIQDLLKNTRILLAQENIFREDIKTNLRKGYSYIHSYSHSLSTSPNQSNDILATEYLKALIKSNSNIQAYCTKRVGPTYNDKDLSSSFSSASAIRKALQENISNKSIQAFLPPHSQKYFQSRYMKFNDDFFFYILYSIFMKETSLKEIFEIKEGLENLLLKRASSAESLTHLIESIKSKRYTYARIRRILFNILLDIKKSDIQTIKDASYKAPYIRILGFSTKGRLLLKKIQTHSSLPLVNKMANYTPDNRYSSMFWKKDLLASHIYNIEKKSYYYDDIRTSPIYIPSDSCGK